MLKPDEKIIIDLVNEQNLSLKNIKRFIGHDGQGLNANLYKGKKKICFILDLADGGPMDFQWINQAEEKLFEDSVKKLGKYEYHGLEFEYKPNIFVDIWLNVIFREKQEKKLIKKNMVFKLKSKPKLLHSQKFQKHTKAEFISIIFQIQREFGDDLFEIINLKYPNIANITSLEELK